ncbi:hypothetical protein BC939DRAFT_463225 [Gamsiella multidivaricata]|uniref:uncharacterized protein n=1 Tax=Gamsiella multidivaricata TaxID=101098 RepID=UPI0022209D6A|nr:uncharacterized protein BC939DRAFT_463225 [Gamsiella multidivaricata]KAG0365944.1 hypothetical protein BGZ54_006009 [Gamsiella multidivaricata]KAI7818426.1 hypothetical protein BC939DRAFT_463225 [Gamsiella multidivaricata]
MTATSSPAPSAAPTKNVFRLHGVNVLNRKNVDSISRLTALEKRRATHILDERQRRDTMNQLLGELANLVRESAAEAQQQQEQELQQQYHQQKQTNPDGTEKRPPVKSNSITTLRNAIAEIRRLRASAGLETLTPPCVASSTVASPSASRSSSPTASQSKSQQQQQRQQQTQPLPVFAPLASQYSNSGSRLSTPVSSPKAYTCQASHHQLQSPPLSPSSPAPHQYSSVSPPTMSVHQSNHGPAPPSLFAPNSPVSFSSYQPSSQQHHQTHYYQQHHPQQSYHSHQSQYRSPCYESVQSHSRPSSPTMHSTSPSSAPSMVLPQSYVQHPSTYQSSTSYSTY